MSSRRILVADDDRSIRYAFRELLSGIGFEVTEAADGKETLERIEAEQPDLLFLDIAMPGYDGLTVMDKIKERGIDLPVIVITAYSTMETTIRAVKAGAYEYLTKPLDVHKIRLLVKRCFEERRLKSELDRLKRNLPGGDDLYELVGSSAVMADVYKTIGAVAGTPNSTNVLILGESGTGKELVARQIHKWSDNPEEPFIPVNVTVLPDNLIESELFGFERGAFTGAVSAKAGKFELAGEGSIFLDEIGDLSPNLQQKLLRVLQEREFVHVGGHGSVEVKARFIAATNSDLEREIAAGRFREDLYWRLNVVAVMIPPLRKRKDDIGQLAWHFVDKYARRMQREAPRLPAETVEHLRAHDWPGNVRELENTVARALVTHRGECLYPSDIPLTDIASTDQLDPPVPHHNLRQARRMLNEAFEKRFIEQRLKEANGNVTRAAKRAGVTRQSFQRLMQKHGILARRYK